MSYNERNILIQDIDSRGGCACVEQGLLGNSMYFLLNFSSFYKPKTALKKNSIKIYVTKCYINATKKILSGFSQFMEGGAEKSS